MGCKGCDGVDARAMLEACVHMSALYGHICTVCTRYGARYGHMSIRARRVHGDDEGVQDKNVRDER